MPEEDPTQISAKQIAERIRAYTGRNAPKGLPSSPPNVTRTDPWYPMESQLPMDNGWDVSRMVQGNGYGPALGTEESTSR